ncbi:hypothetical protein ACVIHI_008782 [Bradyrhizobium sp. USDA 4524]|uniref:hypothetical protein n=1 Tax=unclassified Bradyrhizobium TaxID=2631580 RepID=UPI0020A07D1F|nr:MULTISPECIES: hypothetical protein [unclassified Bradyrhizobium]MCP1845753.1 hypothetical protein [Bradyrhizobium sp. USDA 4538]MCP1906924.1 hypothetical protein [Bradyrhizobium sp. USDA 4537]MCP1985399.1 hypothetical protein [Bradyrhizobium sp. USDA 4539]
MTANWTMAVERKVTRPPRRPAAARRRNLDKEADWSVELAIDRALRVTDAEVQVLEAYLGRHLDGLFEGTHRPQGDIAKPDEPINSPIRRRG